MTTVQVELLNFIAPHIFYVTTELIGNSRANFLSDVSARIRKQHQGALFSVGSDEIVGVIHEPGFARAVIVDSSNCENNSNNIFFCWLVDHAQLIKTNTIFKLPLEIQKATARCKAASLNNICYLEDHLDFRTTKFARSVPSIAPSAGVIECCLDLLSNYDKLELEVVENFENMLIGELIIYHNGAVYRLSEELCKKQLATINDLLFQNLKHSTKEYIKKHIAAIQQTSKIAQKRLSQSPSSVPNVNSTIIDKLSELELEEMDRRSLTPLENGRRRKLLSRSPALSTSSSDTEQTVKNVAINPINIEKPLDEANCAHAETKPKNLPYRLKLLLEEKKCTRKCEGSEVKEIKKPDIRKKLIAATKYEKNEQNSITSQKEAEAIIDDPQKYVPKPLEKRPVDIRKKLILCQRSKQRTSTCVGKSEQDSNNKQFDSSSTFEEPTGMDSKSENSVSSAEMIPEQSRKCPNLFPAGMERRIEVSKTKIKTSETVPSTRTNSSATEKNNTIRSASDDDCLTIKVPLKSQSTTDDQLSVTEAESKTDDNHKSNLYEPANIFTKQDFCKLVSGCTCVKCRIDLENDDWDVPLSFETPSDELTIHSKSKEKIIKPPLLLKSESEVCAVIESQILAIDYKGMSSMQKAMCRKLLVHGDSIPIPIKHVANINIHADIYKNISKINYKESKRIQMYAFPSITRNQNVIMINDSQSGKTMAYLPILISFIMEKEERYSKLNKMGGGPIVVIMCSSSKKCEDIYDLTWLILGKQNRRISLVTYPGHGNISNIDVLITMPTVLSSLISTRATNFKRLCHLALEDADVMLKDQTELIKKFINYSNQVLENRNCPKSIQLIMCARHWTPEIENMLLSLNKIPIVCIGNHLEAALYGKMKFTMQFLEASCKEQFMHNLLKDTFKFTKSVIICNRDEIDDVQTFLMLKGIEFTSFSGVTQHEDILYLEKVWTNKYRGDFSVLLCTDDIYNIITITNAHMLIHFSLPYSWSQFIRRFSCLLENIQSPLDTKERKIEISSFVLIDENCEARMSKFRNFIKIAGLEKALPEEIQAYFQGLENQEQNNRADRNLELCGTIKLFGKCESLHCKNRHVLRKDLDISDLLPQNGILKFKIVKMITGASCSIKLLEHLDLEGKSVQKFEDLTDQITNALNQLPDCHHVTVPVISHLYLYKDKDKYSRCRLVEVNESALVYLLDKGIYCTSALNGLFKMPEELKKMPPQCYEVQLANLIPPFEDKRFSRLARKKAQMLVDQNCNDVVMIGTVVLQTAMTFWIDDVYEYRVMHDKKLPFIGFQLTRELIKQGLAIKSRDSLERLYQLCKTAQIDLPDYKIIRPVVKNVKVDQVKPNWAFLDLEAIHEVIFTFARSPLEFYVRQNKFTKELEHLEENIQIEIRKPFYPILKDVSIGKCCLLRDEVNGQYARGYILKILGDKAEILSVDYGDVVEQEISVLKHITNDLILKLPFQSIQCSMYGVKPLGTEWCDEATDLLYRMAYTEDEETLRPLFVKIDSKQENSVVKNQRSYSTIVKDGLYGRVLINQLLVDCGFALSNDQEIQDFDLPEVKYSDDEEDDDIEEIERNDLVDDINSVPCPDNGGDLDLDAFDCEVFNLVDFMIDMKLPVKKLNTTDKAQSSAVSNQLPAIKAVPAVDYLTPEVYWSQTKTQIKLSIRICDVKNVEMFVKHNKSFQFRTEKEKEYLLNLLLFDKVKKSIEYAILGSEVRVCLTKMKESEWPRLLYSEEKVLKIYYDISAINIEEDVEESKYRPLDLNISDSSSDEDEAGPYYFVCSDLDSDYDFDIPNDDA
ncbi:putative ATP-dependent RNA helicase TDRD12 [Dendroctonus ponderosae]|nr:putative ATP-dependent RNA helicase TDRD12 [Dendroctonus ponderosae]XP_019764657.2 putative ATP-dependent RNA helicase TDRD12 [Dendroctonus ponderosae]KAH1014972.1 hypothetical protein HUJ05_012765 [Dendroctonus ponderosae]